MSGTTYIETCPSCGSDTCSYSDHKPISNNWHECIHCGFTSYPQYEQMSLDELNTKRHDYNIDYEFRQEDVGYLKPLDRLPECSTEPDEWFKRNHDGRNN